MHRYGDEMHQRASRKDCKLVICRSKYVLSYPGLVQSACVKERLSKYVLISVRAPTPACIFLKVAWCFVAHACRFFMWMVVRTPNGSFS